MKKAVKITFQLIVALVIVALLAALVTGCMILFKGIGSRSNFTYMIALGTAVEGTEPSQALQDRINKTAAYMEKNPDVICVVTGYQAEGTGISEAECMYNALTEMGIDPDRLRIEEQATSTRENFQYALQIIEEEVGYLPKRIGILSSDYHLMRAQMIAKSYGVKASLVPANTSDMESFFRAFLREIPLVWYDGIWVLAK